jgi:hypothetical protein
LDQTNGILAMDARQGFRKSFLKGLRIGDRRAPYSDEFKGKYLIN